MPDNVIKKATVVAVEGKVVTLNLSGDKIQNDKDPRNGQLLPETRVDIRNSRISMVTDEDRSSAKEIRPAEIQNGDQLSCSWTDTRDVPEPQNVTLYRNTKSKKQSIANNPTSPNATPGMVPARVAAARASGQEASPPPGSPPSPTDEGVDTNDDQSPVLTSEAGDSEAGPDEAGSTVDGTEQTSAPHSGEHAEESPTPTRGRTTRTRRPGHR